MKSWLTKQFVFVLFLVLSILARGQMVVDSPIFVGEIFESSIRAEVLFQMNEAANFLVRERRISWNQRKIPKRFLGIKHRPSDDFNIYLSFEQLITSNIKTSMEVSLNYPGQVNIRNLIALRRKEKCLK